MFIFVCYKSKNFSSIGKTPKSHKWLKRSATRFMWSKIMLMWSKKLRSLVPAHTVNAHHRQQTHRFAVETRAVREGVERHDDTSEDYRLT